MTLHNAFIENLSDMDEREEVRLIPLSNQSLRYVIWIHGCHVPHPKCTGRCRGMSLVYVERYAFLTFLISAVWLFILASWALLIALDRCDQVVRIPGYLNILSQIVITGMIFSKFSHIPHDWYVTLDPVFLSLRTYALYSRNIWVLVFTLSFGCMVVVGLGVSDLIECLLLFLIVLAQVVLTLMHGLIINLAILGILEVAVCFPGQLQS